MTENQEKMDKALFVNLIMMLSSSALQQMGKLVNPVNNKTEINLESAQLVIDMISMIQKKTKGNLAKEEEKMLSDTISGLQMNYIETANEQKNKAPEKKDKSSDAPAQDKDKKADEPEDKSKSKFHKSYGE